MFKRTKRFAKRQSESAQRAMGIPVITEVWHMLRGLVATSFAIPESGDKETFDEAIYRLGLNEEDLEERYSSFIQQCLMFLFFAIVIFSYAGYLIFKGHPLSGIVTFLMSVMLMVLGLRSHFWAFQISQRKLGCTWSEWLNGKAQIQKMPVVKAKGDK